MQKILLTIFAIVSQANTLEVEENSIVEPNTFDSDRFFEEMIENIDKKCPKNYDEITGESIITYKSGDTECWNE